MKKRNKFSIFILLIFSLFCFSACGKETNSWTNPGDKLGGGTVINETISMSDTSNIISSIENVNLAYSNSSTVSDEIPEDAIYYVGCKSLTEGMTLKKKYGCTDATSYNTSDSGCIQIKVGGSYVFYGSYDIESSFLYIGPLTESVVLYFCGIDINVSTLNNSIIVAETSFTLVLLDNEIDGKSNTISITSSDQTDGNEIDEYSLIGLGNYKNIDVTICGSGSLDINLNGVEGIIVDGTVSIFDTEISMTLDSSAIEASEVIISNSSVSINSEGYGIVATANLDDLQDGDGYEFSYSTGYIIFDDSSITITTQGTAICSESFVYVSGGETIINANSGENGSSSGVVVSKILLTESTYLEGGYSILIDDGDVSINSQMNGIDSCENVLILGGNINIEAEGYAIYASGLYQEDGSQANIKISNSTNGIYAGIVEIAEGNLSVSASNSGIISQTTILIDGGVILLYGGGSDSFATIDSGTGFVINGGTFVACGSLGMVETPCTNSDSDVISFASENAISSGTNISVLNAEGNTIAEITLEYDCRSIIFSSDELVAGDVYYVSNENKSLISFTLQEGLTIVSYSA